MSGVSFGLGNSGKVKAGFNVKSACSYKVSAFEANSDDEEEGTKTQRDHKRQKSSQEASGSRSALLDEPNEEEKRTAEKLAQFVAKNGRQFEDITRQRNPQGGVFKFLFDSQSPGYKYYTKKLEEFSEPKGFLAKVPIPQPPIAQQAPAAQRSQAPSAYSNTVSHQSERVQSQPSTSIPQPLQAGGFSNPQIQRHSVQTPSFSAPSLPNPSINAQSPLIQAQGPMLNKPSSAAQIQTPTGGQTERKRRSRWQEAPPESVAAQPQGQRGSLGAVGASEPAKDDSLAAMEKFAAQAAARDQEKADREAAVPLLNETSFDRRRVMAVYKEDGTRGHHMQDFIPKEELAKVLAKSGTKEGIAQAEAIEAASRIQSDNIGHKLLSQMGWKEGEGLGATGSGVAAPVSASSDFGGDKRGLGAEDHTAVQQGDDEFEVYRKRMMLGYKHRPNPLGNPRKNYY